MKKSKLDEELTKRDMIILGIVIFLVAFAIMMWGAEIFGNCPAGRAC